jgi:2-polyprenyl-3-methyl-5-hydroxy-6-metoxy-1,4-benzoquinol methylase
MEKKFYAQYFHFEREHWWFLARQSIFTKYIQKNIHRQGPLKCLNVGVATGSTSQWLSKFGPVTSIEYDKDCIEFTKSKLDINIEWGDIRDLNIPDSTFDLVCAFDVIEHVKEDSRALEEIIRVCKRGGSILISVPAHMSLWSNHDVVNHHFRRYNKKSLLHLLNSHKGAHIKFISYLNSLLFLPIAIFRIFRKQSLNAEKSDFEFNNKIIDTSLKYIFLFDMIFIINKIALRFGVSLFVHLQKK